MMKDVLKPEVNEAYAHKKFKTKLKHNWDEKTGFSIGTIDKGSSKFISNPFNCAVLENFITSKVFINNCVKELEELHLTTRNNDLFKFEATDDLQSVSHKDLSQLRSLFRGPLRKWMSDVTGIELNNNVAISCSKYKQSDTLLCHDDELEGRRIAFILYLVPPWKPTDGGSLDLFSVDSQLRPNQICERIFPSFNTFAFFEVSPISYHQVSEVLAKNKTRLSINGWFHGEPIQYPTPRIMKPLVYLFPGDVEERQVYEWLNPLYLEETTQLDIKKKFGSASEISLTDFLKTKKYNELSTAIKQHDIKWQWAGPPDRKHFQVTHRKRCPQIIKDFLALMHSEALFLVVSQLTGLQLHPLAPEESEDEDSDDEPNEQSDEENDVSHEEDNDDPPVETEPSSSTIIEVSKKRKSQHPQIKNKKSKLEKITLEQSSLSLAWETDVEAKYLSKKRNEISPGKSTKAEAASQIIKWTPGCYSLMKDDDFSSDNDFTLDARFFANVPREWDANVGGAKVYAAKGEQEELLSVHPASNCLALVYRDDDTVGFTKYINRKSIEVNADFSYTEVHFQYRKISKQTQ